MVSVALDGGHGFDLLGDNWGSTSTRTERHAEHRGGLLKGRPPRFHFSTARNHTSRTGDRPMSRTKTSCGGLRLEQLETRDTPATLSPTNPLTVGPVTPVTIAPIEIVGTAHADRITISQSGGF